MASYSSTDRYTKIDGGQYATRKKQKAVTYAVVTSREDDSFERLAYRYLNDPLRFWEIADINPQVEWPDRIPAGTPIRIPT